MVARTNSADRETPAEKLARIQAGRSKNDLAVLHAFALAGVCPSEIEPRVNVLTFDAWKALGRRVARGASSIRVPVYYAVEREERPASPDGAPAVKRDRIGKGVARLFHVSQTVPLDCEPGTRPAAWNNPVLVKPGNYDPLPELAGVA